MGGAGPGQGLGCRGQPPIDADRSPSVGLVLAVRTRVVRRFREGVELRRTADEHARQREFSAHEVELLEVVVESRLALPPQGDVQCFGIHVRVAVAVATDPADGSAEQILEVGIEARDLAQERRPVVAQRVFDLVPDRKLAVTQEARLPQLRDAGLDHNRVQLALP